MPSPFETKGKFHAAITQLLEQHLASFTDERKLDKTNCTKIYQKIFKSLVNLFQSSNIKLSNEGMNWLAQQYYDGILINGRYELDPNVFDKRAKVENIATHELALLATMLLGTDFAILAITEIKKRS